MARGLVFYFEAEGPPGSWKVIHTVRLTAPHPTPSSSRRWSARAAQDLRLECFRRVRTGGECGAPPGEGGRKARRQGCLGRRSSPGTWIFPRSLPPRAPLRSLFTPSHAPVACRVPHPDCAVGDQSQFGGKARPMPHPLHPGARVPGVRPEPRLPRRAQHRRRHPRARSDATRMSRCATSRLRGLGDQSQFGSGPARCLTDTPPPRAQARAPRRPPPPGPGPRRRGRRRRWRPRRQGPGRWTAP